MAIMDMAKWNELTRNIISNAQDQAALTGILTQATSDYEELFAQNAENDKKATELIEENEGLRKANLDLFLRFSKDMEGKHSTESEKESTTDRAETITIKDLFNKEEK